MKLYRKNPKFWDAEGFSEPTRRGWNDFKVKQFMPVLVMAICIILYAKEPLEVVWGYVTWRMPLKGACFVLFFSWISTWGRKKGVDQWITDTSGFSPSCYTLWWGQKCPRSATLAREQANLFRSITPRTASCFLVVFHCNNSGVAFYDIIHTNAFCAHILCLCAWISQHIHIRKNEQFWVVCEVVEATVTND